MLRTCHRRSQNLKFRTPKNTDLAFKKMENWGLQPTLLNCKKHNNEDFNIS